MATQMQTRRTRQASPERWRKAAQRAIAEHIEVRQVNENGMWVANSGSDPTMAYLLEIRNGVVVSCSCPAGQFGDPCCKHAAKFYLDAGMQDPEPEPPALGERACWACNGDHAVPCVVCHGASVERPAAWWAAKAERRLTAAPLAA